MNKRGFTLIELLVVISIIAMLSSIVLSSLSTARAKARDTRRIQDLNQIRTALFMYYEKNGNWMGESSDCGYNGDGDGFLNEISSSPSMGQCLVNAGFLPSEIIDPSGTRVGTTNNPAYMKWNCGDSAVLMANLETRPHSDTAVDGATCQTFSANAYGMNYYLNLK